uniref:Uncharacterized protein LOC104265812 n=1 Tax=Phallusia mammillata TaxID=59560 RepID=A0A6F9DIZ0_9ASCI|nr:uncharacterized protein LOC104265812 [Phallusia mammillata]
MAHRRRICCIRPPQSTELEFPVILSPVSWTKIPKRCEELPTNAFKACKLETGETGYIAKAEIGGQKVTGYTTALSHGKGYMPYGTSEHVVEGIMVLAADANNLHWLRSSGYQVPKYAVHGGYDRSEQQFIGRSCTPIQNAKTWQGDLLPAGNLEGEQRIGKIHRSHGCLYVPHSGKEYIFSQYEVLCHKISPGDLASICRWNIIKTLKNLNLNKEVVSTLPLPESLKVRILSTWK